MNWSVIYEKAIRDDGSLLFPERLNKDFLDQVRKTMGSYFFANQYQNEVIPLEAQVFKKEWLRYYTELPDKKHTFSFIDPALSQEQGADYTAVIVVDVDVNQNWFVRLANRYRITPTQIVNLVFKIQDQFKPHGIGIEDVAYQRALLYMLDEEMKKRGTILPVKGIKPSNEDSKQARILLNLVPRFEWGRVFLAQGLHDFEIEYSSFPRGSHDDLLDALAYINEIAYYPVKGTTNEQRDVGPNHPDYERQFIRKLIKRSNEPEISDG